MKRTVIPFLMVLLPLQVSAATLSGFITDRRNGEAMPYANVVLKWDGPTLGALSNLGGYYAFKGIPPGTYTLIVSYIGYKVYQDTLTFTRAERGAGCVVDARTDCDRGGRG